MRDNVKKFVQTFSKAFDVPGPIYEFGSLQVEGQIGYADLRPFFSGKQYTGCDFRMGPGVDGDPTARGFYWGVLFLMALPFAVAGSIGGWLVYRYWRAHGIHWRDLWIGRLAWTHKENTP